MAKLLRVRGLKSFAYLAENIIKEREVDIYNAGCNSMHLIELSSHIVFGIIIYIYVYIHIRSYIGLIHINNILNTFTSSCHS